MELTTEKHIGREIMGLFMMSKIQNLNGTHNAQNIRLDGYCVVYDVKDTKFEWNSQHGFVLRDYLWVVYDVKDTKFEWNSQQKRNK